MVNQTDKFDRERSLWMKWRLPGLVTVGILAVVYILFISGGSLLPVILSIIIAELLFPLVSRIERVLPGRERYPGAARVGTIAIVYIAFVALVAVLVYLTVQPIIKEVQEFIQVAPQVYEQAKLRLGGLLQQFNQQVPDTVKGQLDGLLRSASGLIGKAALSLLTKTVGGVTQTISVVTGLVIVPFLLFYMLKDKEELDSGLYSVLPERVAQHTSKVLALIYGAIGSYVRAQTVSATIVGVSVSIGLFLLDVNFALTLGLLAAVFGLIPVIGAFIGAVPGVLVALATDPGKVIWVVLLYAVVQFVESNVISPKIQGAVLRLHPIVIMVALVIASEIAGLWGMLIAVPLVAAARDVFAYFYFEWSDREDVAESVDDSEQAESIVD